MSDKQILKIAEALRVTYLRGARDPQKIGMTDTVQEMRNLIIEVVSNE